jgi:AcrR family transcriptional regulator
VTEAGHASTRDIARAAVRAELAEVAVDLFCRQGFDNVTTHDVAAAAGVSRSTFQRYFGTKEDAVLGAVDARWNEVADALRARPASEDDWTAIRRALDSLVTLYRQDPARALAMTRLITGTPALWARQLEKQHAWHPLLAEALAGRTDPPRPTTMALSVKAAAALVCLNIALGQWTASEGQLDLVALLDEAFAALATR